MPQDSPDRWLRVSLQDSDVRDLMDQFPKLSRTEIVDVITREGPLRHKVEAELARVSDAKR